MGSGGGLGPGCVERAQGVDKNVEIRSRIWQGAEVAGDAHTAEQHRAATFEQLAPPLVVHA